MVWEQEVYFEFHFNRALNDVFTFEADNAMAALYFADIHEAVNFEKGTKIHYHRDDTL